MSKVGEIIKSRRVLKKISIESISKELKISKNIIEDIESDNTTNLKDVIFYIGHLRSYSNFLDLDPNEMVKKYKEQISFKKIDNLDELAKPSFQNHRFKIERLIPFSLIIIIFSSFYFLFINETDNNLDYALIPDLPETYIPIIEKANLDNSKEIEVLQKKNITKNNEINNFLTAQASSEPNILNRNTEVTLKILNSTWLQLRDESNNIILSKLMEKNDEYTYQMSLEYNITAGNAGNILVIINNEVRGKIGKYGEVVDSIILDSNFNN